LPACLQLKLIIKLASHIL